MSFKKKLDEMATEVDLFPDLTTAQNEMNRVLVEIASMVQSRRVELKYTTEELAQHLSISPQAISDIESGDYKFTLETLVALIDSLGMKIELFFREKLDGGRDDSHIVPYKGNEGRVQNSENKGYCANLQCKRLSCVFNPQHISDWTQSYQFRLLDGSDRCPKNRTTANEKEKGNG